MERRWVLGLVFAGLTALLASCTTQPSPAAAASPDVLLSFCANMSDNTSRLRCLVPYFEELTRREGAATAIARAMELQREGTVEHCHLPAHVIGRASLDKSGWDAGRALAACSPDCLDGCYHGVMEAYIARQNSADIVPEILTFCQSVAESVEEPVCVHGSGHGLLMVLKDRPSPLLEAIDTCERLDNLSATAACQAGAMMENVNQYMLFDDDTIAELVPTLCEPVKALNRSALTRRCINTLAETLLAAGHTFAQVRQLCQRLTTPEDRDRCVSWAASTDEASRRAVGPGVTPATIPSGPPPAPSQQPTAVDLIVPKEP